MRLFGLLGKFSFHWTAPWTCTVAGYFPAIVGRPRVELPVKHGRPAVLPEVERARRVALSPVPVRRGDPFLLDVVVTLEVPQRPVVALLGKSVGCCYVIGHCHCQVYDERCGELQNSKN